MRGNTLSLRVFPLSPAASWADRLRADEGPAHDDRTKHPIGGNLGGA